ncbi:MAG: acetyl-CoA carboxylase biotin carboxyl carrier protein subunit [Deltaproteobacteria bacterium]|nr:acetyl-CoA carboxylase biotin carboxyl carrier protein subunit [Deltaproteobacteria bacterium]
MASADKKQPTRYLALHAGEEHELLLVENGAEASHRVTLDGKEHVVDAIFLEGGTWSLLVDGKSYEVDLHADEAHPEKMVVSVRGHRFPLEVLDERRLRMRAAGGGFEVEGRVELKAPMPGKVVKLLKAVGDEVAEGEGVIVVEAMKMENELKAPKAGTLSEIRVETGDTVDGGTLLLVIE